MIETGRTFTCALASALRGVRRSPGLSVAVIITLALGLGANAAIFRVVDRLHTRDSAEPVVVVSRRAAARLWPSGDALTQCLHIGKDGPCARVVGVAGEHAGASFTPGEFAPSGTMQAWVPIGFPGAQLASSLLVRTAVPPARVLADVRRAAAVPGVRYVETELIDDMVARETRSWRLGATVRSLFGLIALVVAGVGLYGVLSFEVVQRRRATQRPLVAHALHQTVQHLACAASDRRTYDRCPRRGLRPC